MSSPNPIDSQKLPNGKSRGPIATEAFIKCLTYLACEHGQALWLLGNNSRPIIVDFTLLITCRARVRRHFDGLEIASCRRRYPFVPI